MKKVFKANQDNKNAFAIFVLIILTLYSLSLLLSMYWSVLTAFKSRTDFRYHHLFQLPEVWIWENFKTVFAEMSMPVMINGRSQQIQFSEMLWNSVWMPLTLTAVSLLVRTTSAYVLAKYKFKGNEVIYTVVFFAMVIPDKLFT